MQDNKVYCTNAGSRNVTVIDGTGDSVITTVPASSGAGPMCFNPQGGKLYCANCNSSSMIVVDGTTDSVVATIAVGYQPYAVCNNAENNKVYCGNYGSGDVTVIDAAYDSVITTISVGVQPTAFVHNPVENRMYVANYGSSSVYVLRDVAAAVEERPTSDAPRQTLSASLVRGVLYLEASYGLRVAGYELLDAAGRRVLDLKPGANNVSRVPPGVYFIRSEADGRTARKVLVWE